VADLNVGRDDLRPSRARFVAFGVVAAAVVLALGGRMFVVQVVDGRERGTDESNVASARFVERPLPAPRGLLFDRQGRPLAVNVPAWTVSAQPSAIPAGALPRVMRVLADVTGANADALEARVTGYPGSPDDVVPLVRALSREAALLVAERLPELPGVTIEVNPIRRYLDGDGAPDGELLAHVIGYTGPVSAEELPTLRTEGYRPDDVIGRSGIESSFEHLLRGTDGAELIAAGEAGGPEVTRVRQPRPGKNLMLTLDAETQEHATRALEWGMQVAGVSQGVTIVMNPQTGEILAMVSLPAHDANAFAAGIGVDQYQAYLADPAGPLRNHAIADIYPPGSTFKLVTSIAALEEGVTTAEKTWPTYACYQIPGAPAGECLFDWNRAGFGPLGLVDAFAKSSDTFYYQLAIELGVDRLGAWASELGFGEISGIRLPGEEAGTVASTQWARAQGRSGVYTGEIAQAGIGQNVIAVTPLQVLNAYAAVANGGRLLEPMVVRGEADPDGNLVREYEPRVIRTLDVAPDTLRTMRLAAREVIASGHAYNIRDLDLPGALSGKTGTAEFGTPTDEGTLPFHSWFVAYLPSEAGATDAELAVITFTHAAVVPGNVSAEVVKYFLQLHYGLDEDLRLDPNDFSLVSAN
jgi:penicillin-binding protein 2